MSEICYRLGRSASEAMIRLRLYRIRTDEYRTDAAVDCFLRRKQKARGIRDCAFSRCSPGSKVGWDACQLQSVRIMESDGCHQNSFPRSQGGEKRATASTGAWRRQVISTVSLPLLPTIGGIMEARHFLGMGGCSKLHFRHHSAVGGIR